MNPHTRATMLLPLPQKHCLPPWEAKVGHDSPDISGDSWQTSRRANLRRHRPTLSSVTTPHRATRHPSPVFPSPALDPHPSGQPPSRRLISLPTATRASSQPKAPFSTSGTFTTAVLGLTIAPPPPINLVRCDDYFSRPVLLSDHEASVLRSSQVRGCQACTRETRVSAVCTPIYGPEGSSGNLPPAVCCPRCHGIKAPARRRPDLASEQSSEVPLSVQQSGLARREGSTDELMGAEHG
ncbi:hypothetical protein B0T18DRAFT_189644 [Schizothecium vesticola]|uniref:Uncharacterized protein n=1 Tax=Schizothecium vesticola TaxID=314040 RepID=A0AA40K2P1_9PEZI|nr:hypothetical protein B0T18DRAFT_189644 [Schizothecium vesticola]